MPLAVPESSAVGASAGRDPLMNSFSSLGIVVIVVAILSVFGLRPKGGRPVGRTRLMFAARIVLIVIGIVLLYLASRV